MNSTIRPSHPTQRFPGTSRSVVVSTEHRGTADGKQARSKSRARTNERTRNGKCAADCVPPTHTSVSSLRVGVAGHHDGGAGASDFWQIAIRGHADFEPLALAPNDR